MTAAQAAIQVKAEVRVERGTAETCACGAPLEEGVKVCGECGREYA